MPDVFFEIFTRDNVPALAWALFWVPVLPFLAWKVRHRRAI